MPETFLCLNKNLIDRQDQITGVAQLVTMARQLIRFNDPNIEPLVDGLDRLGRDFRAAALDPYNDNATVRLGMDLWEARAANLDFDTFSLEFLA